MKTVSVAVTVERTQYVMLRRSSRLPARDFDARAARIAHGLADGEEVRGRHWVQAAREVRDLEAKQLLSGYSGPADRDTERQIQVG